MEQYLFHLNGQPTTNFPDHKGHWLYLVHGIKTAKHGHLIKLGITGRDRPKLPSNRIISQYTGTCSVHALWELQTSDAIKAVEWTVLDMCKQYIVKGQEYFQAPDMDQLLCNIYTSVNVIVKEMLDIRVAMWLALPPRQREERSSHKGGDRAVPADEVIQSTDPDRLKVPGSRSLPAKKMERRSALVGLDASDGGHTFESQRQPRSATPEPEGEQVSRRVPTPQEKMAKMENLRLDLEKRLDPGTVQQLLSTVRIGHNSVGYLKGVEPGRIHWLFNCEGHRFRSAAELYRHWLLEFSPEKKGLKRIRTDADPALANKRNRTKAS